MTEKSSAREKQKQNKRTKRRTLPKYNRAVVFTGASSSLASLLLRGFDKIITQS
mgnify:CR=1 FL=1